MRRPLNGYERAILIAAAVGAYMVDRVEVEEYEPEPPRLPDVREQLAEASRGTPTKGPAPRRRFPVRR